MWFEGYSNRFFIRVTDIQITSLSIVLLLWARGRARSRARGRARGRARVRYSTITIVHNWQ